MVAAAFPLQRLPARRPKPKSPAPGLLPGQPNAGTNPFDTLGIAHYQLPRSCPTPVMPDLFRHPPGGCGQAAEWVPACAGMTGERGGNSPTTVIPDLIRDPLFLLIREPEIEEPEQDQADEGDAVFPPAAQRDSNSPMMTSRSSRNFCTRPRMS